LLEFSSFALNTGSKIKCTRPMPELTPMVEILITVGGLFMIGLAADLLGHHTPLPRVTVLLAAGFALGPAGLDWLPPFTAELFPILTTIALAMVGFLLGQRMTRSQLAGIGKSVLSISLGVVIITTLIVVTGLILMGTPVELALVLGGIATATAPAATADVVHESGATGRFSRILLGVVAIDDAWGLIVFIVLLAVAQGIGSELAPLSLFVAGIRDISIAALIGFALGLPVAFLTGRIQTGEPTQAEALGSVLLTAGVAVWFDVSYILSSMALGMTVASLAKHHSRPFHAIEGIEWPFLILFFFLAGASLEPLSLADVGWIVAAYILLRIIGRVVGAQLGGAVSGSEPEIQHWLGIALLPQAGVAIGMALLACQRLPEYASTILPVVLASTVLFEILGPVATKTVLRNFGP
jgi:Kef-type K+ transport system membrane component KefB